MALETESLWRIYNAKGLRAVLAAALLAIIFGVSDYFTTQIVPALGTRIQHYFDPPFYTVTFSVPIQIDLKKSEFSPIPPSAQRSLKLEMDAKNRYLMARGDPGLYWIELHRQGDRVLPVGRVNFEKRNDDAKVDTAEGKWERVSNVQKGLQEALGESANAKSGSEQLIETRWSRVDADVAQVRTAPDSVTRTMLATALGEVGTFEYGTEPEKQRILGYWDVTPDLRDRNLVKQNALGAWGGAFLTWVVTQAGVKPPALSTAYNAWPAWGESVPPSDVMPGMVALFSLKGLPELRSRYLAGVVLRKRDDCTEIITGNVIDRVVITCVKLPIAVLRRPR